MCKFYYSIALALMSALALYACRVGGGTANCPFVVEVDPNSDLCSADEIFDSYDYTILETTDESLLSIIQKIDVDDRHIIIKCDSKISVFNRDGSFVSSFDRYGQGPEEYTSIRDIKLRGDEVLLLTSVRKGIQRYTFTGEYIGSYELNDRYFNMEIDGDDIWLASMSNNKTGKEFARYNIVDDAINCQLMDFDQIESYISYRTQFLYNKGDGQLLVARQFDTSVYGIDGKNCTVEKLWTYDFKTEKKLSDFDPELSYCDLSDLTRNSDMVTHLEPLCEKGNIIYQTASFFVKIAYLNYIYKFDKTDPANTGKLFRVGFTNHKNFPFLYSSPLMIYKDCYVTATDADRVLSIADEKGISTFKESGLTEDSNPVLFFYHFK